MKRCPDETICPVRALEDYFQWCQSKDVLLENGYLFRVLNQTGTTVLDKSISYNTIYNRLREYLVTLGIYDGETPHSFRGGCAVTMGLSGSIDSETDMMNHIGWFSSDTAYYYSRIKQVNDASRVAQRFADSVNRFDKAEQAFRAVSNLQKAFE